MSNPILPYTLIYKNIKNLYIRVKDGRIIVTAGKHFSEKQINKFIQDRFDELSKTLTKPKKTVPKYLLFGQEMSEDEFFGKMLHTEKNYLLILKKETEQKINELTPWLVEALKPLRLNLVPTYVKKLSSKYGSCHVIKREITISSFMAKLPIIYLQYVLLHEYAHLLIANHSSAFYQVLDKVMINHKEIQRELRKIPIVF